MFEYSLPVAAIIDHEVLSFSNLWYGREQQSSSDSGTQQFTSQGEGGQHLPLLDLLDLVFSRAFSIGQESQGILNVYIILKEKIYFVGFKYFYIKIF
jgi:hypothetical protein